MSLNITILGGGVLGSQIALQCSSAGHNVTVRCPNKDSVENAKRKIIEYSVNFSDVREIILENGPLAEAVQEADLIVESVTEDIKIKRNVYKELSKIPGMSTKIVVTNSSTILPSKLAKFYKYPENFLSMHFSNSLWKNKLVEIMPHDRTSTSSLLKVHEYARLMKMSPIVIDEEKAGYLLNSMLVPFLLSGLDLVANNICTEASVDEAWKLGTGSPRGPFEIIDVIGANTALNIVEQYQKVPFFIKPFLKKMLLPYNYKGIKKLLQTREIKGEENENNNFGA